MTARELAPGDVLAGRYRVEVQLGAGGMGAVYEATQLDLERRVAIKVIDPRLAGERVHLERFRREALAAARLGHPNVTQVIELLEGGSHPPAIVMEHLDGRTMSHLLRDGPVRIDEAVGIALQIIAALEAAHAAGIVHRDLKPANVFLVALPDGREHVKLLDFGIAKLTDGEAYERLTRTGVFLGTPRWSAPEQLESASTVDARADVYGTCALLYAMLAGRPPFTSPSPAVILEVLEQAPPPLSGVPDALASAVRRGLEKRPADRFQSVAALRRALHDAARTGASGPVPATIPAVAPTPVTAPTPATAPATVPALVREPRADADRTRRLVVVVVTAVAVVVTVVVGATFIFGSLRRSATSDPTERSTAGRGSEACERLVGCCERVALAPERCRPAYADYDEPHCLVALAGFRDHMRRLEGWVAPVCEDPR